MFPEATFSPNLNYSAYIKLSHCREYNNLSIWEGCFTSQKATGEKSNQTWFIKRSSEEDLGESWEETKSISSYMACYTMS